MASISEEIHPHLLEVWKSFDERARELGIDYSIEADEPLRQVYMVPAKSDEDKAIWKGVANYMYEVDKIKDGQVLMKIDPGYRKGNVFFELTIVALNDSRENIEYVGDFGGFQERLDNVFHYPQRITINQQPKVSQELMPEQEPVQDISDKLDYIAVEISSLADELRRQFKAQ